MSQLVKKTTMFSLPIDSSHYSAHKSIKV